MDPGSVLSVRHNDHMTTLNVVSDLFLFISRKIKHIQFSLRHSLVSNALDLMTFPQKTIICWTQHDVK